MQEVLTLISSPQGWLLYFFCAMLIGISKTGIQNIGTLTVPFFVLLFGAKESTGIVLILLCFADIMAVLYYRKVFRWVEVKRLLPLAIVGLIVALIWGKFIDDKLFKTLMGVCILMGILVMFWMERATDERRAELVQQRWYGPFFGFILGFSTMIGNAAGPALSVYMLSKRLDKITFAATSAWFIMILNLTKVPLQAFVWKNLSWAGFYLNLMAIPFILLGAWIGINLVKRIPEEYYRYLIMTLVIVSGILLIVL